MTKNTAYARSIQDRRQAGAAVLSLLIGVAMIGLFAPAQADCMRDYKGRVVCDRGQCARNSHGLVYCSRYEDGTAVRTRYGEIVCAKGECVRNRQGEIVCSARLGGAAMKDRLGKVTCEGGCEKASLRMCGNNSAGLE